MQSRVTLPLDNLSLSPFSGFYSHPHLLPDQQV